MMFPVFDLHCDTANQLLGESREACLSLRKNELHVDLTRGQNLPGYTQCFACFTTDTETLPLGVAPEIIFSRQVDAIRKEMQQNCDLIRQAFSVDDIEKNRENGIISGILTIEGSAGFGYDPGQLERLYALGFRITTLGWNEKNPLTGSHLTGGGLTAQGREYVMEAQRLGMLVDVSHISDEAFWDIMDITRCPVIASHSNSRTMWNKSRNLTDDMFLAICKTDGIVGANFYAGFLGEDPDVDTVCDHILHFLSLDPDGKHIGLGGDLDGCDRLPKGLAGIQDYPNLADRLITRGVSETVVMDIFWNNAVRVMKRCCL